MNYKNLKNDFKTRYNTDKEPFCFFAGTPFYILGDVTSYIDARALIITLSCGSALAINAATENNIYSVQQNNENIIYTCKANKLGNYHENDFALSVFKMISAIRLCFFQEFSGADMLFEHSINHVDFQNPLGAVIKAFKNMFFAGKEPLEIAEELQGRGLSKKDAMEVIMPLVMDKNRCVIVDMDSMSYQRYLFPFNNKKLIIVLTNMKKQPIHIYMSNAYKNLQKSIPKMLSSSQITEDVIEATDYLTTYDKRFLKFFMVEEKRIKNYPDIESFNDLSAIIKESCYDFLEIAQNKELDMIINLLEKDLEKITFRPLADCSGVYCIVDDDYVDGFIKKTEREYEKKVGYKPTFYVCDTAKSSG